MAVIPLSPRVSTSSLLARGLMGAVAPDSWDTTIHPADEMFRFCMDEAGQVWSRALFAYMRSGLLAYALMAQVIDAFEARLGPVRSVLDFASGYGRTTRFLLPRLGCERLWVADIQAGAIDFQSSHFGVRAILSTEAPEDFELGERFDIVFVLSLFSHLPARTFERWLARLFAQVSERGCLVFSTLGEAAAQMGAGRPVERCLFTEQSESVALPRDQYGTMWVSRAFVADAIRGACGDEVWWRCFPRSLWHLQDCYVVTRNGVLGEPALTLKPGPTGFLESVAFTGSRTLVLSGWALDEGTEEQPLVEIRVGDRPPVLLRPAGPRADVADRWATPRGAMSGWGARLELEAVPRPSDPLVVKVVSGATEFCIHCNTLEATCQCRTANPGTG